jgi:hypothetical protein
MRDSDKVGFTGLGNPKPSTGDTRSHCSCVFLLAFSSFFFLFMRNLFSFSLQSFSSFPNSVSYMSSFVSTFFFLTSQPKSANLGRNPCIILTAPAAAIMSRADLGKQRPGFTVRGAVISGNAGRGKKSRNLQAPRDIRLISLLGDRRITRFFDSPA